MKEGAAMMRNKPPFAAECVRLGDVCELIMGQSPSSDSYNKDGRGLPFYQGNADFGEVSPTAATWCTDPKKKARPGDVLISVRAPIGAINIANEECCIGRGLAAVRPADSSITTAYLVHVLLANRGRLEAMGTGSTFKAIGKQALSGFSIPVFDEAKQDELCLQFESILGCIKASRRQLALLDDLVKSRFVEMFGDPVENPYGWEKKKLPELGDLKNGVNFKSVDKGYEIRCLGVGDFKNRSRIDDMELVSRVQLNGEPNEAQILQDGDIAFVRSNGNKELVGRCLAIFPGEEKVTFSGFCIRFRPVAGNLDLTYLLGSLKADSMRRAMTGRGANIQNLSQKILAEVGIPIPPLSLQRSFADFVAEVDKSRTAVQKQIAQLTTLYDSLAQDYFG